MTSPTIQRALISVSNKLGLGDFARGLAALGVEIYSTGGTGKYLAGLGLNVLDVADYTEFPEMLDGRLKTLHPKVFGGILCRRKREDDMRAIDQHGILPFELVVVNLYPFEATVARPETTWAEAIEQIDIGGPSLVRAAAKNHQYVTVATSPAQYSSILEEAARDGCTTLDTRHELAAQAFAHTAAYDQAIAAFFTSKVNDQLFPDQLNLQLSKRLDLRYGENPHQGAALYQVARTEGPCVVTARQLSGRELSYNNLLDLDAALRIVRAFGQPAAAVIKHNNPCGAAIGESLVQAAHRALEGDPLSAFGSVLGFNRTVDVATAELLARPGHFIEAIVAPDFEAAAVGILTTRPKWKDNVRLMQVGRLDEPHQPTEYRFLDGGVLVQDADTGPSEPDQWRVVTDVQPPEPLLEDLRFGWEMVRHVKSNAIVLAADGALIGVGAGQMSRVDSVELAIKKAGRRVAGSVLASDAFFPFPDSIFKAAEAGVAAVIQPGGSRQDDEVVAACNQAGLPMIFTGKRHFRH